MLSTRHRFNGTKLTNIVAQTIPDSIFKYSAASSCWMTMVDSSISVGVPWISLGRIPDGKYLLRVALTWIYCWKSLIIFEHSKRKVCYFPGIELLADESFPLRLSITEQFTVIERWVIQIIKTQAFFLRYSTIKLSFLINQGSEANRATALSSPHNSDARCGRRWRRGYIKVS